jgi:hypothetical protein
MEEVDERESPDLGIFLWRGVTRIPSVYARAALTQKYSGFNLTLQCGFSLLSDLDTMFKRSTFERE